MSSKAFKDRNQTTRGIIAPQIFAPGQDLWSEDDFCWSEDDFCWSEDDFCWSEDEPIPSLIFF